MAFILIGELCIKLQFTFEFLSTYWKQLSFIISDGGPWEAGAEFHDVASFTSNKDFDCAILQLIEAIRLRPEAMPVFLPNKSDQNVYTNVSTTFCISGWGLVNNQPRDYQPLLVASVRYYPTLKCNRNASLCTWGMDGENGYCIGDDGGKKIGISITPLAL